MLSLFNTGYGLQDQLDGVKNGIAIVSTGNTHIAITSGQYVYIQDNSTMPEGLYRATANIAANATLSGSNVTAVSGGGLNALNSNMESLGTRTYIPCKYLNDTSKTALELVTAEFANMSDGQMQALRIRSSDTTIFGIFTRHTSAYGGGIFTGSSAESLVSIGNLNGSWRQKMVSLS